MSPNTERQAPVPKARGIHWRFWKEGVTGQNQRKVGVCPTVGIPSRTEQEEENLLVSDPGVWRRAKKMGENHQGF